LSEEELNKLTTLVRESIGFSADRGDSLQLINAPFQAPKQEAPEELPLWKQPEMLDLLRQVAVPAALTLLAVLLIMTVVRPALKAATVPTPAPRTVDAVVEGGEVLPPLDEGPGSPAAPVLAAPMNSNKLDAARQLAKNNPAAVANIVRSWVNKEAAA
jgi:flagellar M-ring protein FliF